jgi:hypothetical protein
MQSPGKEDESNQQHIGTPGSLMLTVIAVPEKRPFAADISQRFGNVLTQ